jgi:glycosyltransferase involved in cell wall biosynthesis
MRIGIYAPNLTLPSPSGVERYSVELVRALREATGAHELVLFTDAEALASPPRVRQIPVPPMGWLRRARFDRGGVARAARKEGVDLLHCTKSHVPHDPGCPGVATIYDVIFLRHPEAYPFWWRWYWLRALGRTVERAAALLCISETTARDLVEFYPAARGKVRVTPIGVDARAFAAEERGEEPVRRGLGVEEPYFLCVGNIVRRKNVPVLLDAWAEARERTGGSLVLVGTPDDGMREVAGRLGEKGVRHLSRVADGELGALYRGARALVYPSRYEGFGLPVLEAMACGCPVVASSGGALGEVVGDAGLLVSPGSRGELAEAMVRVAKDRELRARLVQAGRSRAGAYRWERTAALTLEVYQEVASRRGAACHETPARP